MLAPLHAAPCRESWRYSASGSVKTWRTTRTVIPSSSVWLTKQKATVSCRPPCAKTASCKSCPRPSGNRSCTLLMLREPLASSSDEPNDAVPLLPRDVEGELHPRLAADQDGRRALGGPAVREKLTRL